MRINVTRSKTKNIGEDEKIRNTMEGRRIKTNRYNKMCRSNNKYNGRRN